MPDLDLAPIRALLAAVHPVDAHMSCADCCAMARTRTALAAVVPGLVEEVERLRRRWGIACDDRAQAEEDADVLSRRVTKLETRVAELETERAIARTVRP